MPTANVRDRERECRECGARFVYQVQKGKAPEYCSGSCRREARRRYHVEWSVRTGRARPVRDEVCKVCGVALPPYKRGQPRQFCSRQHAMRWRSFAKLGVDANIYPELLRAQGGCCAVCGTTEPGGSHGIHFHIDHCHKTGAVRGLLCSTCNTTLGQMKDDPNLLRLAAEYLERKVT